MHMIDETMFPRKGIFDRTMSEIRHPNNSTELADINSNRPVSSKRMTERKEEKKLYMQGTLLQATFKIRTGS